MEFTELEKLHNNGMSWHDIAVMKDKKLAAVTAERDMLREGIERVDMSVLAAYNSGKLNHEQLNWLQGIRKELRTLLNKEEK